MVIIFEVLKKNFFSQVVATGQDSIYKSSQLSVAQYYKMRTMV